MPKLKNISGEVYGKLTILSTSRYQKDGAVKKRTWATCKCECGIIKDIDYTQLVFRGQKSCGCARAETNKLRSTHGLTKSPEYRVWTLMKNRCNTKADEKKLKNYGNRGIKVCDRWSEKGTGFLNFLADMGERPTEYHSIERKDNDKGYSPDNCVWATDKEQNNNRRNNIFIEYNFEKKTVYDWAQKLNLDPSLLYRRLERGWTPEQIFKTPPWAKPI